MATPPTFQAEYEASTWLNNTSPKTVTPTTNAGDILCVVGAGSNDVTSLATPTGNSLTYTLAQSIAVGSFCFAAGWTAPDATGGAGWTLSDSETGSGTAFWGFTALRFSGSDGVGASAKTNTTGAPSLNITTLQDNSAIVVINADFAAVDGASRTWRTVNGITPSLGTGDETTYTRDAAEYTVYVAYYSDAGAAGVKTVGLSAPSGQTYSIIAVEIKGAAGGAAAPAMGRIIRRRPVRGPNTRFDLLRAHHARRRDTTTVAGFPDQLLDAGDGITSAETFGAVTVTPGAVTITATGISGVEAIGAVALTQTITAAGIPSVEATGQAAAGQGLAVAGISSAEQSGAVTVTTSAAITATGISSAERAGSPTVGLNLTAAGITSSEAAGQSALGQGLVAQGIGTAERLGAAVAAPGAVTVTATGVGSAETVGAAQASLGAPQSLTTFGISGAERLGTQAVTVGPATIAPTGIPTAERLGAATVTPGAVSITATGIGPLAAAGQAVTANQLILFGIPTVERSGQSVLTQIAPTGEGDLTTTLRGTADLAAVVRGTSSLAPATRGTADTTSGERAMSTLTATRRDTSTLTGE